MDINILGTNYKIYFKTEKEEPALAELGGFCDETSKRIVVYDMVHSQSDMCSVSDKKYVQDLVLRHELIHAFLIESGLLDESDWAANEEMVDYFARQFHKIEAVFNKLKI